MIELAHLPLLSAEDEYRAGNPKPLANFIREHGLPQELGSFVADIVEGKFRRTKHDTHRLREEKRLSMLSSFVWHYQYEKKLVAAHPDYVPDFANLAEVYDVVARYHNTTIDALKKTEQRERKREAELKRAREEMVRKRKEERKNRGDK